ncbi:NAD(P)-binding protein [Polyplosphaeria fusca]|uniref:NAD(P)-binding protein n=1 Tax=Polyplosphaeria fusca TaxID=682080 RepID=A0A9P4QQS9_9PLEO|nr:NAD(P)-binding protein [Polyplosphaeria fusca]
MDPPYPSMTSVWHTTTYPALIPTGQAKDKVIVISGASSGIGRAAAISFATAGAKKIALLARRHNLLDETRNLVQQASADAHISIHAVSTTDGPALKKVAEEIGKWDVLVLNAGRIIAPESIEQCDVEEWWSVLETNVKGTMHTLSAFLPSANANASIDTKPTILGVSAGTITLPTSAPPNIGASAYNASKTANVKILEHLATERQDLHVVNVHPGVVATDLMKLSGMVGKNDEEVESAKKAGFVDDASLPADFLVWASTRDAAFLHGKFVFANWDVEQLKNRAKEIGASDVLTNVIKGWPFSPSTI